MENKANTQGTLSCLRRSITDTLSSQLIMDMQSELNKLKTWIIFISVVIKSIIKNKRGWSVEKKRFKILAKSKDILSKKLNLLM